MVTNYPTRKRSSISWYLLEPSRPVVFSSWLTLPGFRLGDYMKSATSLVTMVGEQGKYHSSTPTFSLGSYANDPKLREL